MSYIEVAVLLICFLGICINFKLFKYLIPEFSLLGLIGECYPAIIGISIGILVYVIQFKL